MKGYLITDPANVLYLTGFKSSNTFLLKTEKKNYLFTDNRYIDEARKLETKELKICMISKDFSLKAPKWLEKKSLDKIFYESHHLTIDKYNFYNNIAKKSKIKFLKSPEQDLIIKIREIKSSSEIKKIKKAQKISLESVEAAKKLLKPGVTEAEISWKIKNIMHSLDADGFSFEPIVAFDKNSAVPHHQSSNTKLKENSIVLIDAGAKYKNYCGDITRTFLPKKAGQEMQYVYNAVNKAQTAAINKLKESKYGIPLKDIDIEVRDFFKQINLGEFFTHSLGHGVGLNVHEEPRIADKSTSKLTKGQVFSIEPGIYLPNKFGVRIEDLYFV